MGTRVTTPNLNKLFDIEIPKVLTSELVEKTPVAAVPGSVIYHSQVYFS
jgi:hypothetical protein